MKSMFRPADNAEVVQRIRALRPDARAQWGEMDVAQMLAHLQAPLRVATGELQLKRGLVGLLFGRIAKKKLTGPEPFAHGLPTTPEFRVREPRHFPSEQARLLDLVERFGRNGPAGLTQEPHPFFGRLTPEEWDLLQWKHLDHHLRQFGA